MYEFNSVATQVKFCQAQKLEEAAHQRLVNSAKWTVEVQSNKKLQKVTKPNWFAYARRYLAIFSRA